MTTQPSLIATMVAALELRGGERVLEVGTGLGFQTAILALLAHQVVSIERLADLAAQARANLAAVPGWAGSRSWSATAPWASPSTPSTRRSWSRPQLHASRRRSLSSLPGGPGWSIRSGRAATSRSLPSTRKPAGSSPTPSSSPPGSSLPGAHGPPSPRKPGRVMTATVALAGDTMLAAASPGP